MDNINYEKPIQNGDIISDLPADETQPSHNEIRIVNALFKEHNNTLTAILKEGQDAILVALLFIILSFPQIDDMIKRFLPVTEKSEYFLIGFKALIIMILFWIVKHYYLARKTN